MKYKQPSYDVFLDIEYERWLEDTGWYELTDAEMDEMAADLGGDEDYGDDDPDWD